MHKKIYSSQPEYPVSLKQMQNHPKFLYVEGDIEIFTKTAFTFLGGGLITDYGKDLIRYFAGEFCEEGHAIVFAYFGSFGQFLLNFLQKIGSFGICVLGGGFGQIEISQSSNITLVSPFNFLARPTKKQKVEACKIAVGLSLASIILEVGSKKAVYEAVETSLNLGREVFAVPGSVFNPRMSVCHDLIKSGAHLASDISDITDILIN